MKIMKLFAYDRPWIKKQLYRCQRCSKKPLHKDTLIPAGLKENNVYEVKKPDLENKQEIKSVSPNDKIIQGSEDDQIPLTKDEDPHQTQPMKQRNKS